MSSLRTWIVSFLLTAGVVLAASAQEASPAGKKEFDHVDFGLLAAFNYTPPGYETMVPGAPSPAANTAKPKDQIPEHVRALHAKKVAVTGFMLPTKLEKGRVREFLLMKDQSGCCFGAMPRINEWIIVKITAPEGIPVLLDVPLTVVGNLKVGEVFEEGYLSGIYQLDGERLLDGKG